MADETIFEKVLRVENKDIFIDLKQNRQGTYLKISERNGTSRSTVLIPASGLERLCKVLEEAVVSAKEKGGVSARVRKPRVDDPEIRSRSVYVSGISWATGDEELLEHMSHAEGIVKATVLRVREKRSLGCGLVEYDTREHALNAITVMNDTELGGRKIHCREDRDTEAEGEVVVEDVAPVRAPVNKAPKKEKEKKEQKDPKEIKAPKEPKAPAVEKVLDASKVFCTNLSWDTTPDELSLYFSQVGLVTDAEIMNRNGRSLGCGFVEFSDVTAVGVAIAELNSTELKGRPIVVREYYQ